MFDKLRQLSRDSAIYGFGDIAVSVVNFLLLPLYVAFLSDADYGVLGLLGAVEVIAKVATRWGVDGSFMRFFYDCDTDADRQRLASTIFFFLIAANGALLATALIFAPHLSRLLFADTGQTLAMRLVLLNTFLMGFTFLPFHVLRIQKRAVEFSSLTLARSVATVAARLALLVGLGLGVLGVVLADLLVTIAVMAVLTRRFVPLIRPVFSRGVLRECLRFGLPRLPHAGAQQVIAVGDKFVLEAFRPIAEVGIYSMGVSFGLTLKLFLSAFESAWAPFYYATAREPGAPAIFRTVTTYGAAALVLLAAMLAATARDLLDLMTRGLFIEAAPVVAWTAVGVVFQGMYLLTSIGLNLTKRTAYYPVATITAAAANLLLNVALVPRFGMLGAAWSNAAAYALQAAIAFRFSQRFYPVPHEYGRLWRVGAAAIGAYAIGVSLPALAPPAAIVVRGVVVFAVFTGLLWTTGFFAAEELALLQRLRRRGRGSEASAQPADATELAGQIVSADVPAGTVGTGEARSRAR